MLFVILIKKCIYNTGILKIITDMFLPHIRLSELEEQCFAIFLPKVKSMLNL